MIGKQLSRRIIRTAILMMSEHMRWGSFRPRTLYIIPEVAMIQTKYRGLSNKSYRVCFCRYK